MQKKPFLVFAFTSVKYSLARKKKMNHFLQKNMYFVFPIESFGMSVHCVAEAPGLAVADPTPDLLVGDIC